jgi:hypothetical protein
MNAAVEASAGSGGLGEGKGQNLPDAENVEYIFQQAIAILLDKSKVYTRTYDTVYRQKLYICRQNSPTACRGDEGVQRGRGPGKREFPRGGEQRVCER